MKRSRISSQAFTTIELMVVISLIALLTVFGILGYARLQEQKAAEEELAKLRSVIRLASEKAAAADASICQGSTSDLNIQVEKYILQINSDSYTLSAECTSSNPNQIKYRVKRGKISSTRIPPISKISFEANTGKIIEINNTPHTSPAFTTSFPICFKLEYKNTTRYLKIENIYAETSIQKQNC